MNLTQNFSLYEMTYSTTAKLHGIDNTPPKQVIQNLRALCENILQPLRNYLKVPVVITSGYRCAVLNKRVGGVANSQHCLGMAADFVTPKTNLKLAFDYIKNYLEYDQLLYEYAKDGTVWVHVSYNAQHNRRHSIANYKA